MNHSLITVPTPLTEATQAILAKEETNEWIKQARELHIKYMEHKQKEIYIKDYTDAMAYLALRMPATYAQIAGAFTATQVALPDFKPTTMLDIGSGPGSGLWAAKTIFPSISDVTCIDREYNFLLLGKKILEHAPLDSTVVWKQNDAIHAAEADIKQYDIVLIANVLNELNIKQQEKLVGAAFNRCKGVLVLVEPGTPLGSKIVQDGAKHFSKIATLLAPYVQNSFVTEDNYWLHFSEKFLRPHFLRRLRNTFRDDSLSGSDTEEAKYSYTVISKIPTQKNDWGRCIGTAQLQKGFLEIPILTKTQIRKIKVLKRNKEQYAFAKKLRWGESIAQASLLGVHDELPVGI